MGYICNNTLSHVLADTYRQIAATCNMNEHKNRKSMVYECKKIEYSLYRSDAEMIKMYVSE